MIRIAKSKWFGSLNEGRGFIVSNSGELSGLSFSYDQRFNHQDGFNPEEIIAAAHSSCLSMAIASELQKRDITAESIDVTSAVSFENIRNSWTIPEVTVKVTVTALGADTRQVEEAANIAKVNCPISKLLRTSIKMDLYLITQETHSFSSTTSQENNVESSP